MGMFDGLDLQNLSEDQKAWLRSWNKGHLIPAEGATRPVAESEGSEAGKGTPEGSNDQENGQEAQGAPSGDVPEDEGDADYNEWTVDELQDELVERGLPKSGKKEDLVARLEADDAKS